MIKRIKEYKQTFHVEPIFAWFDLWVGIYIDRMNAIIYFFPIPMFGLKIYFPKEIQDYTIIRKWF